MPLNSTTLKDVTTAADPEYSGLVFARGEIVCAALLVKLRKGGFLLALPGGSLPASTLEAGMAADKTAPIGPHVTVRVNIYPEDGGEVDEEDEGASTEVHRQMRRATSQ